MARSPEVAAVARAEEATDRTNHRILVWTAVLLATVFLMVAAGAIYITAKVDGIAGRVDAIRTTQKANTVVAHCQAQDFDQVLTELFNLSPITAPPKC